MIKDFKGKETKKVYYQQFSKKLPPNIQRTALRKMILINEASSVNEFIVPPENHLERLSGDRNDQWSIWINNQYRVCFTVDKNNNFHNVEITDYH